MTFAQPCGCERGGFERVAARRKENGFSCARLDLTKLSATFGCHRDWPCPPSLNTSKRQRTCGKSKVFCRNALLNRRASLEISRKASRIKLLPRGDFSRRFAGAETKNGQN
ncbi:hypothetical protein [Sulfitobacter mediterraneus]|uniref:hypothetical protein n=1 Tax=Sulfitobacter mediterraneus TaxID=83219 RepID=UPI0021A3BE94|nr:hypothetical protein [Sulfitobacter mediterraneus]UWR10050.1 hypothetical protein K3753_12250 [Sulfitobacter mediterraneus]